MKKRVPFKFSTSLPAPQLDKGNGNRSLGSYQPDAGIRAPHMHINTPTPDVSSGYLGKGGFDFVHY
jgi:hypothetical protein